MFHMNIFDRLLSRPITFSQWATTGRRLLLSDFRLYAFRNLPGLLSSNQWSKEYRLWLTYGDDPARGFPHL